MVYGIVEFNERNKMNSLLVFFFLLWMWLWLFCFDFLVFFVGSIGCIWLKYLHRNKKVLITSPPQIMEQ